MHFKYYEFGNVYPDWLEKCINNGRVVIAGIANLDKKLFAYGVSIDGIHAGVFFDGDIIYMTGKSIVPMWRSEVEKLTQQIIDRLKGPLTLSESMECYKVYEPKMIPLRLEPVAPISGKRGD